MFQLNIFYIPYQNLNSDFIYFPFLQNTIKYMLKYKIVSGTIKNGPNNDNNILCLKERSKLYRFLNNVNI